jgi:hypothetical protein
VGGSVAHARKTNYVFVRDIPIWFYQEGNAQAMPRNILW